VENAHLAARVTSARRRCAARELATRARLAEIFDLGIADRGRYAPAGAPTAPRLA